MINAAEERLLQSPWALPASADAARAVMDAHPTLTATAGATSPNAQMVVLVLASQVEPAMKLLKSVARRPPSGARA